MGNENNKTGIRHQICYTNSNYLLDFVEILDRWDFFKESRIHLGKKQIRKVYTA